MVVQTLVKRNSYYDSVTLMTVSSGLAELAGVDLVSVVMGTALNLELLVESGLGAPDQAAVGPNDLVIAVRAADQASASAALDQAVARLTRRPSPAQDSRSAP